VQTFNGSPISAAVVNKKIGYVDAGIRPNLRPDPRGQVAGVFLNFFGTHEWNEYPSCENEINVLHETKPRANGQEPRAD
jgi:hypothetical protein